MGWKKGVLFVVVTLLLLTGLKGLQPTFRHWKNERQVDELLRTDAFFRTIVADHPALREALRVAIVRAYDTQRPEDLLRVQNEIIGPLLPKYMARSSDAAAVGFARSLVADLKQLGARDPEECYRHLFPEAAGPPARRSAESIQPMAEAMRQVVESAQASAEPKPARPEALKPVYARLRERYGPDLEVLRHPEASDVDRKMVCAIATDLYAEVIQLPEPDAASAMRHLSAVGSP